MKPTKNQAQLVDSSAIGRDGYVRVRPTWKTRQIHQMDAGGFGRQIGWMLGAFISAPLLLVAGEDLAFWQIVLGIAASSILGALVGHMVARAVWGRIKRSIDAVNPRQVLASDVRPGDWMMTRNDGTNRAIRIESSPERTEDPQASLHPDAEQHVRFMTSTGRYVTMPASHEVTVVDLAEPVDLTAIPAVTRPAPSPAGD